MKNNEQTAVSTRVQTFTFDNGDMRFAIDIEKVGRSVFPQGEYDTAKFDELVGIALKTLIHRTSNRPKGEGEDATDWLIDAISGAASAGRFRVTAADETRAKNALKAHAMAPEQSAKEFKDKYGIDFLTDPEALAKHYMSLRAAKAAAEKAESEML